MRIAVTNEQLAIYITAVADRVEATLERSWTEMPADAERAMHRRYVRPVRFPRLDMDLENSTTEEDPEGEFVALVPIADAIAALRDDADQLTSNRALNVPE